MFQQTSVDGTASHHLIRIDRMADTAMELSSVQTAVQRMIESNDGHAKPYDGSMLHLLSSHDADGPTPFVVLPRAEYNQLRQEISNMKQSLTDFQSAVNFEIQQLKQESTSMKTQLDKCSCERRGNACFEKLLQLGISSKRIQAFVLTYLLKMKPDILRDKVALFIFCK